MSEECVLGRREIWKEVLTCANNPLAWGRDGPPLQNNLTNINSPAWLTNSDKAGKKERALMGVNSISTQNYPRSLRGHISAPWVTTRTHTLWKCKHGPQSHNPGGRTRPAALNVPDKSRAHEVFCVCVRTLHCTSLKNPRVQRLTRKRSDFSGPHKTKKPNNTKNWSQERQGNTILGNIMAFFLPFLFEFTV